MSGASSPSPALGLVLALAVGLAPPHAHARVAAPSSPGSTAPAPSDPPPDTGASGPTAPISAEAAAATHEAPAPETPTVGRPLKDPPKPSTADQPSLVAPPNNVSPPTAGMGGRLMSADDPEARRAEAELEGTALTKDAAADVPARLPPLQRRGWWFMFGAFALASTGGVFAGLAEVQEDKAERLTLTLDADTGARLVYADIAGEYDDILKVGRRDAALAKGFLAAGGGFLIAGITFFIIHASRGRKAAAARARLRPAAGGLEVRF
jgi:hypothetical protein